ncbi:MAG TPA: DnaA N-terminal domain-containing protein, partial [Pyrinomonadaceae bacterium]
MNTSVETNVWGRIVHSLKGRLNQQTFETWFSPIQFESLDSSQHVLNLRAPNQVVKDWVVSHYASVLTDSLNDLHLSDYSVGWVIGKGSDWRSESPSSTEPSQLDDTVSVSTGGTAAAVAIARESDVSPIQHPEPTLSPKYTYESFVVGSCNQFAHAASMAVAEAPGRTYNPLYLYGG